MTGELTKYPRTSHLPSSPGATSDDRILTTTAGLESAAELVVTEKMDGGNVTLTRSHFFARSLDSGTHPWDTHAKAIWSRVSHEIPTGWRVSGESLTARRSVGYDDLPDHLLVFGVWNAEGVLLGWDETVEWCELLGLHTVPVIHRGPGGTEGLAAATVAWAKTHDTSHSEGFVVRDAGPIPADQWSVKAAKWVRAGHVTTTASWRHRDDFALNTVTASASTVRSTS